MPSFDAVSKIKLEELDNALNQARKEISTRYDFQGTQTELVLADDKLSITLKSTSEGRVDAAWEVLLGRLIKRGVSVRAIEREKMEKASLGSVKQLVKLQQGIPIEKAKELIRVLKDSKLKVTAAIQADQLRVTGKNRDDLQSAMAMLREQQDPQKIELQFTNFRD